MIEVVDEVRCIECDICVKICPRDVFDATPDGAPIIARKAECQTCFLCELYCPTDALFVAPNVEEDETVDFDLMVTRGLVGGYQRGMGWARGKMGGTDQDPTRRLRLLGGF